MEDWVCILTCKEWIGPLDLWETRRRGGMGEEEKEKVKPQQSLIPLCFHKVWLTASSPKHHNKRTVRSYQQIVDLKVKVELSVCTCAIKCLNIMFFTACVSFFCQNNKIMFVGAYFSVGSGFTAFHHGYFLECKVRNAEKRHCEVKSLHGRDKATVMSALYR